MTAQLWTPGDGAPATKRHAPATERNREAITAVLAGWLPAAGTVLEIASGSGEHVVHFAATFADLAWQPSDPDPAALASIAAWSVEAGLGNLPPPLCLDATSSAWPIAHADAILCINMIHISPWEATEGLMLGAARLLPPEAPLILYGPFVEAEVETAPSNIAFDASLRSRDPAWGLRDVADVAKAAAAQGLSLQHRVAMPANNLMLKICRN